MKKIYIDFNKNIYEESFEFKNEIYNNDIKRLAIDNVNSISYSNKEIKIQYGENTLSVKTEDIERIEIN